MLMPKNSGNIIRYQSAISDNEVNKLINEIKRKQSQIPRWLDEIIKNNDENFDTL